MTLNARRSLLLSVVVIATAAGLIVGGVFDGSDSRFSAPKSGASAVVDSGSRVPGAEVDPLGSESEPPIARSESEGVPRNSDSEVALGEPSLADDRAARRFVLRGRVLDEAGRPLVGVGVQATEDPGAQTGGLISIDVAAFAGSAPGTGFASRTDDRGEFELRFGPGRDFLLMAQAEGRPMATLSGHVPEGRDEVDGLEIELDLGAAVQGTVVQLPPDLDEPLTVVARRVDAQGLSLFGMMSFDMSTLDPRMAERSTTLQSEGGPGAAFELNGLHAGEDYEVFCVRGFDSEPQRCSNAIEVRAPAVGVELRFVRATTLRALVVDAATGEPVEGAQFAIGQKLGVKILGQELPVETARETEERSDDLGLLETSVEPSEEVTERSVQVRAEGYFTADLGERATAGGGVVDLGTIRLDRAPEVSVVVSDRETGEPIEGAFVELAEFIDLTAEMNTMRVERTFEHNRSQQQRSNRWLQSGGRPERRGQTDEDGLCTLPWDFAQAATLTVRADGYAIFEDTDLAPPADSRRIERSVTLGRGGTVEVTVLDTDGEPIVGQKVLRVRGGKMLPNNDNREVRGPSDADGRVVFTGLGDGEHRFSITEDDESGAEVLTIMMQTVFSGGAELPGWRTAFVQDGTTVAVTLQTPKTSTVFGRITLGGEPLEGATVRLISGVGADDLGAEAAEELVTQMQQGMLGKLMGGGKELSVETDFDGGYELAEIPYGPHRIQIDHASLAMPSLHPIEVFAPSSAIDLAIPAATVRGRVVDETGAPVSSIEISITTAQGFDSSDVPGSESAIGGLMGFRSRSIRTDGDGRFELRGLRLDRELKLRIRGPFRVSRGISVPALGESESRDLGELIVEPAGRVLVRTAEEASFGQVRAVWLGEGEPESSGLAMIQNGSAVLRGLMPGLYRIELVQADGEERSAQVTVRPRGTAHVDL